MNTSLKVTAACVAAQLVISSQAVVAEEAAPLGSTIVTATRTATLADEVLAPVIVITREDLERSLAPDIATLLQMHAGLDVGRNGGPGQVTSVFVRGTDSNHATVLIDGVRMNPATIGGAQIQNIAPESVERIEVVKGPRSTLYGTDAIGGVINVITRAYTGDSMSASAGYGRYDTRQASFAASHGGERGDVTVSGSWFDSEGFPARTSTDTDRGYDNRSFTARARWRAGPADLGVRGWHASGTTQYSDFFLTPVDQDFLNSVLAADVAIAPTANWSTRLTVSRIEDDIRQNQSEDRVRTRRNAFDWQNDVRVGEHHSLTAGALLTREHADTREFGTAFDADTDVDMVFLQDRFDLGRHNLLLAVAGIDHETFGREATWNAEYGLDIGRRTRLVAAAGTGFRAPDSTDRFGFGGNPQLDPERSRNYELSVRHRPAPRHELTLSAFRNEIDDLIEFVVLDPQTFEGENRNVERARIEGGELTYEYRGDDWHLRAEAISQDPRNLTRGTRLLRRARESLTLTAVKRLGAFELGFDLLATGAREDFGGVKLESYTLLDLTGRWFVNERWSLQARLENALDEQYELAQGFNTADRGLFVAMRCDLR